MSNFKRRESEVLTATGGETISTSSQAGRNASKTEEKGAPMSVPVKSSRRKLTTGVNVFLDVIWRTLPFMPPHIATMVEVQYLTGMLPKELCRMTVGSIKRHAYDRKWRCDLGAKNGGKYNEKFLTKTYVSLCETAYALLLPYLKGKKPEELVFTPWIARQDGDFYDWRDCYTSRSYREAIGRAIARGNKVLPSDQRIPYWTPCLIEMIASRLYSSVGGHEDNLAQWDLKHDDTATHKSGIALPPVATRFEQYATRQQSLYDSLYEQRQPQCHHCSFVTNSER